MSDLEVNEIGTIAPPFVPKHSEGRDTRSYSRVSNVGPVKSVDGDVLESTAFLRRPEKRLVTRLLSVIGAWVRWDSSY